MPDFSFVLVDPPGPPPAESPAVPEVDREPSNRYRAWAPSPGVVPAFLDGPWGRRWSTAIGLLSDALVEGARQAVRARWISVCPDDALALHGKTLGWEQAPGETIAEYRKRLLKSWYLAEWVGTAEGIRAAFEAIGLTNVTVMDAFNTPTFLRPTAPGHAERYHWFWAVVRPPHPFGTDFSFTYGNGTKWGAAPTGSSKLYGVNGDPRLLELLRRLVRKQKPASATCEWIAIVLSGDIQIGVGSGDTQDGAPTTGSKVAYLVP